MWNLICLRCEYFEGLAAFPIADRAGRAPLSALSSAQNGKAKTGSKVAKSLLGTEQQATERGWINWEREKKGSGLEEDSDCLAGAVQNSFTVSFNRSQWKPRSTTETLKKHIVSEHH